MHLLDVHREATSRIQSARAHVTLEVLRLLVLHEHFFILELALTVPAPGADDLKDIERASVSSLVDE